jgi:hypothetical protein
MSHHSIAELMAPDFARRRVSAYHANADIGPPPSLQIPSRRYLTSAGGLAFRPIDPGPLQGGVPTPAYRKKRWSAQIPKPSLMSGGRVIAIQQSGQVGSVDAPTAYDFSGE